MKKLTRLFTGLRVPTETEPEPTRAARREQLITEAAYYRAEKRGFEAGHELEDWIAAEQEIDALVEVAV